MRSLIPRSVWRYRRRNPYSYRALFTILDALDNKKALTSLALVAGAYLATQHWLTRPATEFQPQKAVAVENSATQQSAENFAESQDSLNSLNPTESASPLAKSERVQLSYSSMNRQPGYELNILEHPVAMKWLQAQNTTHLVVQFASSPDKDALLDFARENFQSEALIYAYKKTPSNRPVYGLASGLYPDLETAQQALASLPGALRDYKPWIRPIGGLLEDMENTL